MAEFIRSITSRLREYLGNRRRAPRYKVRLSFNISLVVRRSATVGKRHPPKLEGYTRDISETGLALIIPAIRIGEHHLTSEGRTLLIALELPAGPINMQAIPARYERLDEDETETGYLLGVSITEMAAADRARLNEYLKSKAEE